MVSEDSVALLAVLPLLAAVGWYDLRYLRIPDAFSVAALAVFGTATLAYPPDDLLWRGGVALMVFVLCLAGFAARMIGGGDVKLLPVLFLFVPVAQVPMFANAFAAGLLVVIALVTALRRLPLPQRAGWAALTRPRSVPMGLAMALAGAIHLTALHLIAA
jgi:prepilin peptidase CpaA